ncbi:MotA/TolQ/ExbB proton channel family protein [Candidatus Peregrinibacteria bacterium]|nr:MotA/TolQ/ExbB proton channel family protein [Candidatus Peregrinibacteria bacterium]
MTDNILFNYFLKGGFFMFPILLCSILSLTIFFERLWALQKKKVLPRNFIVEIEHLLRAEKIQESIVLCKASKSPISRILLKGIQKYGKRRDEIKEIIEEVGRREAAYLDKYVESLSTIASVSTLLGLLGTIAGMIKIFGVISLQKAVNPSILAGGISEALYTTSAGLSVAIPTLIFYRFISGKSDSLILEMEEYCMRMVELLKERQ